MGDGDLVVAHEPEVDRLTAGLGEQRQQGLSVGVAYLTGGERPGPVHQLVARRHHADSGRREDAHGLLAHAREHAEMAGGEHGSRGEDRVAR